MIAGVADDRKPVAVLSACELYRYRIECAVQLEGPSILYVGINPSRAETGVHDHTTRKWCEFTRRAGGGRWVAINPFAYRATDVRHLTTVDDPVGPLNHAYVSDAIAEADVIVPCWGNLDKLPPRLRSRVKDLERQIRGSGKPVRVFGFTLGGDPKHPLMLGYSTPLVDWL